ncbi:MAG: IS21-like element helper ATPase IstB [Bacteroidales bacterium]
MNTETTLYQLEHQLKLKGMANKMKSIIELPSQQRPSFEILMAEMVEDEIQYKKDVKTAKLLKASKLRYKTPLVEITCSEERNLKHSTVTELASCDFIMRGQNVLITGKAGCGKTWLSCALGRQACLLGYKVKFYNMLTLSEEIAAANITGTYLRYIERLMRFDLIILDDFGLKKIDENSRLAIYQLLDGNKENYRISIIITSQLPFNNWYDYLTPGSQTESILDRLFNNATRIELEGKSLRKSKK